MNGMTLMPAPIIEQTPVATRPSRPISRASPDFDGAAGASGVGAVIQWRLSSTREPSVIPNREKSGLGRRDDVSRVRFNNFGSAVRLEPLTQTSVDTSMELPAAEEILVSRRKLTMSIRRFPGPR